MPMRATRFFYYLIHFSWLVRSVILAQVGLVLAGAVTIAAVEKMALGDAIYFAFITGLTIGYGDIVATTTTGRTVSVVLGFVGITFTGLVAAIAVRALHETVPKLQDKD
jgi:hypothetical protein